MVAVQLLSHVRLSATPWTAAHQDSLSFTISWNLFKLMSVESIMPFSHLILCRPLLLLPSIFPSIRVFSNELALRIRWPEYQRFSFSISPSSGYLGLISFRMDWFHHFFQLLVAAGICGLWLPHMPPYSHCLLLLGLESNLPLSHSFWTLMIAFRPHMNLPGLSPHLKGLNLITSSKTPFKM